MDSRDSDNVFRLEHLIEARSAPLGVATLCSQKSVTLQTAQMIADMIPARAFTETFATPTISEMITPPGTISAAVDLAGLSALSTPPGVVEALGVANTEEQSIPSAIQQAMLGSTSYGQISSVAHPLREFMATAHPLGGLAQDSVGGALTSSWKPAMMRWAEPLPSFDLTQYVNTSLAVSEIVQPVISLAATQALRDLFQSSLHGYQVHIEHPIQIPDFELPSIGELFPDTQPWPDYPLAPPPQESSPSKQPKPEGASVSDRITKEDLDKAVAQAVKQAVEEAGKQRKTPVLVQIRNGLASATVIAVVKEIAVEYVHVDDYAVRIAVKGVQVVVDGVSYLLSYLP